MAAQRLGQSSSYDTIAGTGVQLTGDDAPVPSVQAVDDASRCSDLPTQRNQDRDTDQRTSDQDGNGHAQSYCPWWGGPLTEESREAANRTGERMLEPLIRWHAGDLSVRGLGNFAYHRGAARHSGQAVPRTRAAVKLRSRAKIRPILIPIAWANSMEQQALHEFAPGLVGTFQDSEGGGGRHCPCSLINGSQSCRGSERDFGRRRLSAGRRRFAPRETSCSIGEPLPFGRLSGEFR